MARIRRKNITRPDEVRRFPQEAGVVQLTRIGSFVVGRGVVEPGFRWTTHMRPVMGTDLCPLHHVQVLLSGRFGVRMDDGEEVELEPNDVVDIPPGHDAWVIGDEPAVLLDFAGNIDAIGVPREHERAVTTLVMTDIVGSTDLARRLGDAAWKQVLADHNRVVRTELHRFGGTEVNTTGDGFLLRFPSAVAALRCASAVRDGVRATGVEIRAGVHTGEVELIGADVGGVTVHAAARVMALAGESEVLASAVTVGLADGSGLAFEDRGRHTVKGLERAVEVFRLVG